ncbi:hypothetical protein ACJ41O_014866 [Fusarium nematophilum]
MASMDEYNEYKQSDCSGSCPLYPQRSSPRPKPLRCAEYIGSLVDNFDLQVNDLDGDTVVMVPSCFGQGFCRVADCQWYESPCATRHHEDILYENCRPREEYLPLIYQWCLHVLSILSALSFCHSKDIIVGYFEATHFWLSSPDLCLSLVGFVSASWNDAKNWTRHWSDMSTFYPFSPFTGCPRRRCKFPGGEPNVETDLFIFGTLLYELVTTRGPDHGVGAQDMIAKREWPMLEGRYFGDVVVKYWEYGYKDAQELRDDVVGVMKSAGWEVEGDCIKGFDAANVFKEHLKDSYAYYTE